MATTSYKSGGGVLDQFKRELVADAPYAAYDTSPFLSMLLERNASEGDQAAIDNTIVEWHEYKQARPISTAAAAASATATAITVATGDGSKFRAGDFIMAEGSTERIRVTSVSTDTLTVVRAKGGTTGAAIASGATILKTGHGDAESLDWADDGSHAPIKILNYAQNIVRGFKVSGTVLDILTATNPLAAMGEVEKESRIHLRLALEDLARSVINGVAEASTPEGSSSVVPQMNGLVEITREGTAAGYNGNTTIASVDFDSADTALYNLLGLLKNYRQGGGLGDTILCSDAIALQLDKNLPGITNEMGARERGVYLPGITARSGRWQILAEPMLADDQLIICDLSRFRLRHVRGRQFKRTVMGKAGDHERFQIVGQYVLEAPGAYVGQSAVAHYGAVA